MPRQNRVTPFGELVATPERGGWMGNRGRLHDADARIVRSHTPGYRAWIVCLLEFKGRHRELMQPNRYTELFFLDEATGFAAGHRPCGECRRADYVRFKDAWLRGNPDAGLPANAPVAAIDRVLDRDRLAPDGTRPTYPAALGSLPDGAFVLLPDDPATAYLHLGGRLLRWSFSGYAAAIASRPDTPVRVLTPRSIVNALAAGYRAESSDRSPESRVQSPESGLYTPGY
jgi:hypothetical protein